MLPLEGITVVAVEQAVAAPFATRQLVDLGARVIKIERPEGGDFARLYDTNVKGLLYVTRTVLPGMVERGRGHIVNVGSVAGHQTYAGGAVYSATKYAVRALTDALRYDVLGKGIRVSNVEPGLAETEFSEVRFKGDRARAKTVYEGTKPLLAEDVADAVVWCITRPEHVNVQSVLIMPTDQASAHAVHRRK